VVPRRDVVCIRVDGVLFEQVLVNLVENAAKHTPPDARIDVSVRAEDTGAVLEVSDRGDGIPAGEEERLFEEFQSFPAARRAGGTGLGLALCRAIVQAHGGTIRASNRPGGGAVFRVDLPPEDVRIGRPAEALAPTGEAP
jgi:two-component system sensor histidine kinase KdpD